MATKKAPKKRTTAKRTVKKTPAISKQPLVGLAPETETFFTFRLSKQSLYWLILGVVVVGFTMWIMKLESEIMAAYDRIDANSASISDISEVRKQKD